ncbi:MAG: hypothetical protein JW812_03690 [Alphaproteobacteria bacterium]|nr:hypothetical protein [Alphaproteobacteria bacterium]MBN2779713.1 hypothetical protein [Alphaproteobacteria bacterium]
MIRLFIIFCLFSTTVFARPQANWAALFGKRFQEFKFNITTSDPKQSMELTFLDTFPCYRDASWGRSNFKVDNRRQAYIKIRCIYPPEWVRFAFKDEKVQTAPLGFKADADGIIECLTEPTERKSKFNYDIDLTDCHEEILPDSFTENK